MPADRMLHPRAGHSDKVSSLSDFEYRVWSQYMLSADDFGLMPCEAIRLQADNRALVQRPVKTVQKALERLVMVRLLKSYQDPQGRRYICDPVWQKYQHVEYPKQSINPPPPDEVLADCHPLTQELFRQCFGKKSARFRLKDAESSANSSREIADDLTLRAPARAETATANGSGLTAEGGSPAFRTDGVAGTNPKDQESLTVLLGRFKEFWSRYPRQDGRESAWKAYLDISPNEAHAAEILAGVERFRLTKSVNDTLTSGDCSYVTLAKNWLRELRWLDASKPNTSPAALTVCQHRHSPPCQDAAACSSRYLRELQAPPLSTTSAAEVGA